MAFSLKPCEFTPYDVESFLQTQAVNKKLHDREIHQKFVNKIEKNPEKISGRVSYENNRRKKRERDENENQEKESYDDNTERYEPDFNALSSRKKRKIRCVGFSTDKNPNSDLEREFSNSKVRKTKLFN